MNMDELMGVWALIPSIFKGVGAPWGPLGPQGSQGFSQLRQATGGIVHMIQADLMTLINYDVNTNMQGCYTWLCLVGLRSDEMHFHALKFYPAVTDFLTIFFLSHI